MTEPNDSASPVSSSAGDARRRRAHPVFVVAGGALVILALLLLSIFVVKMGLPGIVGGGMRAADSAAVSRLRTLLWAQDTARKEAYVDRDGDGLPEYAFIAQLAATALIPGRGKLAIPLLIGALARLDARASQGVMVAAGYCHTIYLPRRGGGAVAELTGGGEPALEVDPDGAERFWVAYAWPVDPGRSGRRVFFINQDEEIWESDNLSPDQQYRGIERVPAFHAALPIPDFAAVPVEDQPHGDGGAWVRWRGKRARTATSSAAPPPP